MTLKPPLGTSRAYLGAYWGSLRAYWGPIGGLGVGMVSFAGGSYPPHDGHAVDDANAA